MFVYNYITEAIIRDAIGFLAGLLAVISILPQVIKAWKTKSTNDISTPWILVAATSLVLWIIYGFGINSMPLIIMSTVEVLLMIFLLILKMIYDRG